MSIAQAQKIKDLEAELNRIRQEYAYQIALLQKRVEALESRPKPGRPPKNG